MQEVNALAYAKRKEDQAKLGLKYGIYLALISITIQGLVTGHEMGVAVAEWNPEKFAAMEANTPTFIEKIVAFLAYGDFNAKIPEYYKIPDEFKPPLIVHYLLYKNYLGHLTRFGSIDRFIHANKK